MDADTLHSEKQPEHMATGTAENQEQPLAVHKLWSPVLQHRVFDLTAQARHLKKKKLHNVKRKSCLCTHREGIHGEWRLKSPHS